MSTIYTDAMREKGAADAAELQTRSADMTGTQLYSEEEKIPDFQAAKAKINMLQRPVGFVCKSSAGRVVKLLQVYDSTVYTQEPEDLPAQWGFVWSTDPAKALPFVAISTSPYNTGECCTEGGKIYRSTIDANVWAPSAYPQGWQEVSADAGPVEPSEPYTEEPGGGEVVEPEPTPEPEEPTTETYPDFVQPTGGHDSYNIGDRVTYNGKVYESTINSNVWAPDAYPQGWKVVEV